MKSIPYLRNYGQQTGRTLRIFLLYTTLGTPRATVEKNVFQSAAPWVIVRCRYCRSKQIGRMEL
ncbi:hypothetical protein TNIN_372521, partial [Trichonephila inaurata madagascariensis]